MKKGFDNTNVFWMNTFWRRERRGYGEKINFHEFYSSTTFTLHEGWCKELYANLSAKVVVMFGQENQRSITKAYKGRYENLQRWGGNPVTLRVLYKDNTLTIIERIVLHVHHTEHFYYNWTVEAGTIMDFQLNTAAALAGVPVRYPKFFEDRALHYSLADTQVQTKGFLSTVIQLARMEANDGLIFKWDKLPLTKWVEKSFGVESELAFWEIYSREFNTKIDTRVNRNPSDGELKTLGGIKAQPAGRLAARHHSRKTLPSFPEIKPFARKSGFNATGSKLHEISEARSRLSADLNQYLTLPDTKEKMAQNEEII